MRASEKKDVVRKHVRTKRYIQTSHPDLYACGYICCIPEDPKGFFREPGLGFVGEYRNKP
jgi:hypothetical protein